MTMLEYAVFTACVKYGKSEIAINSPMRLNFTYNHKRLLSTWRLRVLGYTCESCVGRQSLVKARESCFMELVLQLSCWF